jgi:L-ornithine N5-oxygenase
VSDSTAIPVDVLGIGFGPSNLALAIAVEEHNALRSGPPVTAAFVERQPRFGWHRGMLIDDATMQVSFLKDLVTMRNPTSDYSFVSYLHSRGRLADFINHKILFPLRIEFHDYLEWAAARMDHLVAYGQEVTDVQPVVEGGTVVAFDVVTRRPGTAGTGAAAGGADVTVRRARNVVVAVGLAPSLPPGVELGPRTWHNLDLLSRVETLPADADPRRFVVVGAGQSAAEVVEFLHRRFPSAEVCSVFARWGYTPSDDTPYANRIFDPDAVDVYYGADEAVKRMLFDYHRNTNYSVVDQDLINELYRREYQEKVQGRPRLRMLNASRVADVRPERPGDPGVDGPLSVEVEFLPDGERTVLAADAIVYATGYRPTDACRVLGVAGSLVRRRSDGAPEVGRDYRMALDTPARAGVYLQGGTEHAHGITSTLLSNIAVRTGEIVESVAAHRPGGGSAADLPGPPPTRTSRPVPAPL